MKTLLLILIILFGFSACSVSPQETLTIYQDKNVTKLQTWGDTPDVPAKAKIDRPIAIKDVLELDVEKRKKYVAVKRDQLAEASRVCLVVRNGFLQARDGLMFYEYQVQEWNKAYTK